VDVADLGFGVWRWTAGERTCFYVEAEQATLLVDPVVPDDEPERFWRALDRDVERRGLPVVVLLTGAAGREGADAVAARYGGTIVNP
jgi:hypothetical protein